MKYLNPVYWINVLNFGKPSADAGCSILKSGAVNSAIQIHSISVGMGWTAKTQDEIIEDAHRCVKKGGDFIRL